MVIISNEKWKLYRYKETEIVGLRNTTSDDNFTK